MQVSYHARFVKPELRNILTEDFQEKILNALFSMAGWTSTYFIRICWGAEEGRKLRPSRMCPVKWIVENCEEITENTVFIMKLKQINRRSLYFSYISLNSVVMQLLFLHVIKSTTKHLTSKWYVYVQRKRYKKKVFKNYIVIFL